MSFPPADPCWGGVEYADSSSGILSQSSHVPVSPLGITKSKTALFSSPLFVTAASVPGSPVVTEPTCIVAAAPVAPSSPSSPSEPAGPVGPVTPVAPPGPVGPVAPVAPPGPVGPIGPVAPVAPSGPVGPVGPVEPFIYAQH